MIKNYIDNYFFIVLAILPISILVGPTVSLTNILIFDLSFLILLAFKKDFYWINNTFVKALFLIYLYLIFNTFISLDYGTSIKRNFGFFRLIIFFLGINYFFRYEKFNKVFLIWSGVIIFVIIDIFIEKYTGSNILGYGEGHSRVVSFFKDEAIIGGYVYSFAFLLVGYHLFKINNLKKYNLTIFLLILFVLLFTVISTGERSTSIKFFVSLLIFLFFYDKISIGKKLTYIISFLVIISLLILNNDYLKHRMFDSIKHSAKTFTSSFQHGLPWDNPSGNLYAKLYRSGYDVFKKYPYFGVGNKNYRVETCNTFYQANIHLLRNDYVCETHPHQIYFEFISEHGAVGTVILLGILLFIFFKTINKVLLSRNYIGLGCIAFIIPIFTPLVPSGAFFSDFNITLFFLNLSLVFATTKNLNVFNYLKNEKK